MNTAMMDRIRDEMAREPAGSPIAAIGEYVTERIMAGAEIAADKTLAGAYKAMYDWASRNRNGAKCVCVPPDRAFEIVDKYFGFVGDEKPQAFAAAKPDVMEEGLAELDLDALLGGL